MQFLSSPFAPPGTQVIDNSLPESSDPGFLFKLPLSVTCPLYVCHVIPSPRISWASSFSVSLWIPCQLMLVSGVCDQSTPHRLLLISSPAFCWYVFSHKSLLLVVFGQRIWRILLRQLLIKVFNFMVVVLVVLHVSAPYNSTYFTLELTRRIFVCNDNTLALQMFLSCIILANPCEEMAASSLVFSCIC